MEHYSSIHAKLVITTYKDHTASILIENGKPVQISLEPRAQKISLGNIYVGRVQKIVKNIDSAFIRIDQELTGYYSLSDNRRHWILRSGLPFQSESVSLKEGDEILVQVSREAVKTKAPVLSSNLSLTGRYCVLTTGSSQIGFSSKISSQSWKDKFRERLKETDPSGWGLIVRTNAKEVPFEMILEEYQNLKEEFSRLLKTCSYRTQGSLLYQAPAGYITDLKNTGLGTLEAIITDCRTIYDGLNAYLSSEQPEDLGKLTFYEDPLLSLTSLYSLETAITQALQSRVWLKSGGYLVIEPTEAMTVIDVNSGKFTGKKQVRETLLKINLEAAKESARQMRLRNLSGIIIIDFIDMEAEEDRQALMACLREQVCRDPVKTTVVDMTPLNLVEITRKKIRRPLHEQATGLLHLSSSEKQPARIPEQR